MRSSHTVDRIDTAFDDERLVAGAGLLLPATLALHLGLKGLADRFLDLGRAAGAANVGDKLLTLVMSALAGGDSIDDADALRAGGTSRILGFSVKAPSTLGQEVGDAPPVINEPSDVAAWGGELDRPPECLQRLRAVTRRLRTSRFQNANRDQVGDGSGSFLGFPRPSQQLASLVGPVLCQTHPRDRRVHRAMQDLKDG